MTTEADLLAAIDADPSDDVRLVYADWLMGQNDPRGHLIVLDHLDRAKGLTDPELLTQFLWLTAEHGFPHLPDPDAHMVPWERADNGRAAYEYMTALAGHEYVATFDKLRYHLRYHGSGYVEVRIDKGLVFRMPAIAKPRLADEELNVILSIASKAIRSNTVHLIAFPETAAAMLAHPDYRLGPFPRYTSPEMIDDFRHPEWTLSARDFKRWYVLWERLVGPTRHDA